MHILHLISSAGYYGAENMLANLTKALERRGHSVTIGLMSNTHRPNNDVAEIVKAQGLPVEIIVCDGRINRNAVRAITDCMGKHGTDVIHAHGYKADLYALAATRRLRVPLVSTCHNWPFHHSASLATYSLLDVICLRYFDMAVAVSGSVAAVLRRWGIPENKITTIANGVDVTTFEPARPALAEHWRRGNGLTVGMVARLIPQKGHEYLLRSAPEILARFPETAFVFVGDGPQRKDLEHLVKQLGIGGHVRFLGDRRDMPEVYASMDIVALPSLKEGMPMVILEALAAGKAVIATPVGDIPKLIRHEETGLLVDPQDVAGLRDSLLRLIAQPELRRRLAANGRARVDCSFSSDAMARQYETVYERICSQRAAGIARHVDSGADSIP